MQRVAQDAVLEHRERLHRADLVVIEDHELAERLLPLRVGEDVRREGPRRKPPGAVAACVRRRAGDDRREVRVDDGVAVQHVEDGRPRLGVAHGIAGFVIDDRLAVGGGARGGQIEVRARHLAAVPAGALRLDDDGAEEAGVGRSAVPLAARLGPGAVDHVFPLALGVVGVGDRLAHVDQAREVGAHPGAVVDDPVDELQAHGVDRSVAGGGLVLVGPRGAEQVLEIDSEAVSDIHPQHDRPRALVRAQPDVTLGQLRPGDRDHVAPQGVHHALGLDGAQAVPEEHLVEGDNVRPENAVARLCLGGAGGGGQDERCRGELVVETAEPEEGWSRGRTLLAMVRNSSSSIPRARNRIPPSPAAIPPGERGMTTGERGARALHAPFPVWRKHSPWGMAP